MIKATDLSIAPEKLEREYSLVEVSKWVDYNTKQSQGYTYTVLLPKLRYEKLQVNIKSETPIITQEELECKGMTSVVFDGLKTRGSLYQNRLSVKAEATAVKLVEPKA